MIQALHAIPTWLLGVVVCGGAAALSVGGMLLVRKRLRTAVTAGHNDMVGDVYAVVGTMYSIFLAFLIFIVWDQYNAASSAVAKEAATVGSLFQSTEFLPASIRQQARSELITYTTVVISKEWRAMADGTGSRAASDELDRLYHIYDRPTTLPREQAASTESAPLLDRLTTERAARIQASGGALNSLFWVIVLLGGVVTVGFSFLFYLENTTMQGIMVASVAALIAALLFLLLLVDHPFSGDIHVTPDPFQTVLQHMRSVGVQSNP